MVPCQGCFFLFSFALVICPRDVSLLRTPKPRPFIGLAPYSEQCYKPESVFAISYNNYVKIIEKSLI